MRGQVVENKLHCRLYSFWGTASNVRCENDIVQLRQTTRHVWLSLDHVECSPTNTSLRQHLYQRCCIYYTAPRDVDEKSVGTKRIQNS